MKLFILMASTIAFIGCGGTTAKTEIVSTTPTPTASPSKASKCVDVDPAKVLAGTEFPRCNGSVGTGTLTSTTYSLCSSDGQTGCLATTANPSVIKANIDTNKMLTTQTVAGVSGSIAACSGNNQTGCLTSFTWPSADLSNAFPGNIANGVEIGGVTGNKMPTKQCRNTAYLTTFDATSPVGNFPQPVASIASSVITVSIGATGVYSGFPVPVRVTATTLPTTSPVQINSSTTYYAVYAGSTTTITLAQNPDGSGPITISAAGSGVSINPAPDGVASLWDTIDDYNNNLTVSPGNTAANQPWGSSYVCNESNFTNVTTALGTAPFAAPGTTPANADQAWTQVWEDNLTGMYFTNVLYDGSGTPATTWADAINLCNGLNGVSNVGTGWRLPTEKELMQLYIDGIAKIADAGGVNNLLNHYFWSASANSPNTGHAWAVHLSEGAVSNGYFRYWSFSPVLCVR